MGWGLTGFGMAIILVPLLGLVIPPAMAVTLAIFLQLLIGPVGLPAILADADRKSAITLALIAMATTPPNEPSRLLMRRLRTTPVFPVLRPGKGSLTISPSRTEEACS